MAAITELELELSYLAEFIPPQVKSVDPRYVEDTYFSNSDAESVLRLRRIGDSYLISKKVQVVGKNGTTSTEQSIVLSEEEYRSISCIKGMLRVQKNRFHVNIDGKMADVDVFLGDLSGLVIIEFEFMTEEDMNSFEKPSCCGNDVSNEVGIAGFHLAGKNYSAVSEILSKHGYSKL
jgi:CYTH domain-containing protein